MELSVEPRLELLVELFRAQVEILLNDLASAHDVRIGMHHVEQLRRTPAVLDVVADLAGLKVRHEHLGRILRAHEAAIELGNRQELFFL